MTDRQTDGLTDRHTDRRLRSDPFVSHLLTAVDTTTWTFWKIPEKLQFWLHVDRIVLRLTGSEAQKE